MIYDKNLSQYEQDLKESKKKYEKLLKQMKKARSEHQYYNLYDEAELLSDYTSSSVLCRSFGTSEWLESVAGV